MSDARSHNWHEANQRCLMVALAVVRETLARRAPRAGIRSDGQPEAPADAALDEAREKLRQASEGLPAPSAIDALSAAFALTPFERDLLLLCAGMELDSTFPACCAEAQGDPRHAYPTFSLALAALPEAHWSALIPSAPLRRFRLIEVGAGESLTSSPLRIDERVLNYLAGASHLDERLQGLVEPLRAPSELPPSHHGLAKRMIELWLSAGEAHTWPAIQLCGDEQSGKRAIAAAACAALSLQLYALRAADVPLAATEREALARLWERETALGASILLLDCEEIESKEHLRSALALSERLPAALVVTAREPLPAKRFHLRFDVRRPAAAEQQAIWQHALGPLANELDGAV
jgi:hypothetical protein